MMRYLQNSTRSFAFAGGDLDEFCSSVQLCEIEIISYTSQILNGLCYLHSSLIVHLDLKPANIVLTENKKTAKICAMDSSRKKWSIDTRKSDVSEKNGTLWFTSPELLQFGDDPEAKPIGRATDIWSLGCIVLYMFGKGDFHILDRNGKRVSVKCYRQAHYFTNLIADGGVPVTSAKMSANMRSFISNCLKWKPEERMSGASLLDHQVFKFYLDFDGKDMLRVDDEEWTTSRGYEYPAVWNPRFDFLIIRSRIYRGSCKIAIWHCLPVKRSAWSITGTDSTNIVMQKKAELGSSRPWDSRCQWSNDGQRLCIAGGRVQPRPILFVLNWKNS